MLRCNTTCILARIHQLFYGIYINNKAASISNSRMITPTVLYIYIILMIIVVRAGKPETICYKKWQLRYREWYACGKVTKSIPVKYVCPHKDCYYVCEMKKTYFGKVCTQTRDGYYNYIDKSCQHTYDLKEECRKTCNTVTALCVKDTTYEYIKYCPKLRCEPMQVEGSQLQPEAFIDFSTWTIYE